MKRTLFSSFLALTIALAMLLAGCGSKAPLTLEQHPLQGIPQLEPLAFTPQDGSQQAILQVHAAERSQTLADQSSTIDGNQAITSTLDGQPLVAEQFFNENYSESYVQVTLSGNEIYRIPTGPASPVPSLRGLWVIGNHWAMETVLIDLSADNVTTSFATGQVSLDAVLQNQSKGYQEAFGLQTLAGKLFYFFKKDGKIGYSYDGQEIMLGYDEILHYNCCSESALNPVQAQDMVAFFARTGNTWYYNELGTFGK